MDLQKLAQLAKSNPETAKIFLQKAQIKKPEPIKVNEQSSFLLRKEVFKEKSAPNEKVLKQTQTPKINKQSSFLRRKKTVKSYQPIKVNKQSTFLKRKEPRRTLQMSDRVFTEQQLQTIVSALIQKEVAKIPKPKDGQTPTKEEITAIIQPLMPVIRQPKDGKHAEWTPDVVDKIANKVLKQVAVTPNLTDAIIKVFSEKKITLDDIPGFTDLKERIEKLARNQKFIGQGKGIAAGYTDSDVRRVLAADGYIPGGGVSELLDATLTYTGNQLTTVTTSEGDTELTYTGNQLTSVTLPNGTIATLTYSGNQLISVEYS